MYARIPCKISRKKNKKNFWENIWKCFWKNFRMHIWMILEETSKKQYFGNNFKQKFCENFWIKSRMNSWKTFISNFWNNSRRNFCKKKNPKRRTFEKCYTIPEKKYGRSYGLIFAWTSWRRNYWKFSQNYSLKRSLRNFWKNFQRNSSQYKFLIRL